MTKEQLRQYRHMESELKIIEEEMQRLTSAVYSIRAATISGMPRPTGRTDPTNLLDKLMEMRKIYIDKWDELIDLRLKIELAIDSLPPQERNLMRLYYIQGLTWERVCIKMGYAWAHIHRMHSRILKKLKDDTQ